MRRILRIVKRVVLGVMVLVVAAVIAVLVVVHTHWGRNEIRERIRDQLARMVPGGVELAVLDGSVVGDVALHGVVLRDRAGRAAVKVGRVEVNLGLLALLGGEIRLEHVTASDVDVDIVVGKPAGKPLNLVEMLALSSEPLAWQIALLSLRVTNVTITADIEGSRTKLALAEITGTLGYRDDGARVDATLGATGTWVDRAAPIKLAAGIRIAGGIVFADKLELGVGDVGAVATRPIRFASPTDATGEVRITAPDGALRRLLGDELAASPAFDVTAGVAPGETALGLVLGGTVAGAAVAGHLDVNPVGAVSVRGEVTVTGKLPVIDDLRGTASVDLVRDPALALPCPPAQTCGGLRSVLAPLHGRIVVTGTGATEYAAVTSLGASAVIAGTTAEVAVTASGPGTELTASGAIAMRDTGALDVTGAHVLVSSDDLSATSKAIPVRGRRVRADLRGTATISGASTVLALSGTASGRQLRFGDHRAAVAHLELRDASFAFARPTRPGGSIAAVIEAGVVAGLDLPPKVTVTAARRPDGRYRATARSEGGFRDVDLSVDAGALVSIGDDDRSATIDLESYTLRLRGVEATGSGGHLEVRPDQITAKAISPRIDSGRIRIEDATYAFARGDVDARLRVDAVQLAAVQRALALDTPLRGMASATIEVHRKRGLYTGSVAGSISGFAARPEAAPIDLILDDGHVTADGVTGHLRATSQALGELEITGDVSPPGQLDDAAAWARLERRAIRRLDTRASRVDLAVLARTLGIALPVTGVVDADLQLGADRSTGTVRGRALTSPALPAPVDLDATIELADAGAVRVTVNATLRDIARGTIAGELRVPARPFDLAAWRALDITAVRAVHADLDEIALDDARAARFGIGSWRGRIAASLDVTAALEEIHATIHARQVTGGPLVAPIDLVITGLLDDRGVIAQLTGSIDRVTVLTGEASAPIDPDGLVAGLAALRGVSITGSATVPETPIAPLLSRFGHDARLGGTIRGTATLRGTIGAPIATASLVGAAIGSTRNQLKELRLDATYAAGKLDGAIHGVHDDGGTLDVVAAVDAGKPREATAKINARRFQLAPLSRLAPDLLLGVRGTLDADLRVKGFDPATASVLGVLSVHDAQVPIMDAIGAVTGGAIDLRFSPGKAHLALNGRIESGALEVVADATLDGVLPRTATLDVSVRDLSLITTLAPRLAGALHAEARLEGDHWAVTARLRRGRVVLPEDEGTALHPASPPPDVVFVENGVPRTTVRAQAKQWLGGRPSHPFLEIALRVDPIEVHSKLFRGEVGGRLDLAIGDDGLAMDGDITVPRGEVVIQERRYRINKAALTFDGPPDDPVLDIALQYDFAQMTMWVALRGRLSDNPQPELKASNPTYTEGQLLGFLLGGSPGGNGGGNQYLVAGAASALASQIVGSFVTRRLPVRIDRLYFEPATATSSASVTFGREVTRKLLVLMRTRIAPRPAENNAEVEFEYWLGRRVLFDGVVGDNGALGADLLWFRSW